MAIQDTHFQFPNQTSFYRGKVRDVYTINDLLISVATDRISAFDHILPKPIPFKGQVLNQVAVHHLNATKDIVPNWLLSSPDPNVSIGVKCEPIKIEMVIRGYLAGHAWRTYNSGLRTLCGVTMPEGLRQNDPFPNPIITPATKAEEGHDEDISREEIISSGLISEDAYVQLESATYKLFERGQQLAKKRNLILVDTKYEFGFYRGRLHLIDEIHTPDSSRYFYLEGYQDRQEKGQAQPQLSKEFVREWLMSHGFQGKEGDIMPEMPESFVHEVSEKYIELYNLLIEDKFVKADDSDPSNRIYHQVSTYLKEKLKDN